MAVTLLVFPVKNSRPTKNSLLITYANVTQTCFFLSIKTGFICLFASDLIVGLIYLTVGISFIFFLESIVL